MKICVLGLDCAAPEILFNDERLKNIRRLMEMSVYGPLESVIPPITVPAWMCMATSQDPGSLGVYGFRNRSDYSYDKLAIADSNTIKELTIWDQFAREGKRSILVGVPPSYPPRRIHGINVGCFLTPNSATTQFTHPASIKEKIQDLVGDYPVDVQGYRSNEKERLKEQIFEMSRKQWTVVRWLISEHEWDYFQFVDIGLDRIHHSFWNYFDKQHKDYVPGNPYEDVVPHYYLWLDEQIGSVLELLDEETTVLIMSDHGVKRLDGGFAINEWLVRQGLLVLDEYPQKVTPFEQLKVNWSKTRVWSEGGYYARIFFNVAGREPNGILPPADYEAFQAEMKLRLESITDCNDLPTRVYRPQDVYTRLRNVAPDLIVYFGDLYWRSLGSVGHGCTVLRENDSGPDGCNHSEFGAFLLSSPHLSSTGRVAQAGMLDIAPTLLLCAGMEIPDCMQGKPLFDSIPGLNGKVALRDNANEAVLDRLKGLGYV